ncbi:MAG: hypothetical protein JW702_09345 [Clostridiales bacterium]|nr:hypothetical protein [Clostridiales bacterium]
MNIFKFHQFVHIEHGQINSAIINFLSGDIFQISNEIIEKFSDRKYSDILPFLNLAKKEKLIIEIDDKKWIPSIPLKYSDKCIEEKNNKIELEIEEGINLKCLKTLFDCLNDNYLITYYGNRPPQKNISTHKIIIKQYDYYECINKTTIISSFKPANKDIYEFNMNRNSCWGNKIAITNDYKIRPCIYSNIVIGEIKKDSIDSIIRLCKQRYWSITKDKVKDCNICELRYVCFDCREIAWRTKKDLFDKNPLCKYNPHIGKWNDS